MNARQVAGALALAAVLGAEAVVSGQAAGTMAGTIDGTVTDATRAPLAGVTVTIDGSAMMGSRVSLTDAAGRYWFHGLLPGNYRLTASRDGFQPELRDAVYVGIRLVRTIDVELRIEAFSEQIVVRRAVSPIDRQSTTLLTTFGAQQLASLPIARNMWSLLAVTPAVFMGRADVGGSEAASGVPFSAYGPRGANVPSIEGIFVSGMSATGFPLDYGSFEEASMSLAAHAPEMTLTGPHPRFVTKSGGNRYAGSVYVDRANRAWQSFNVDADQIRRGADGSATVAARDENRLWGAYDVNADAGGYIRQGRAWWYASLRQQSLASRSVEFPPRAQEARLSSYTLKTTYQPQSSHRLIAFAQAGHNHQPHRLEAFGPVGGGLTPSNAVHPFEDSTTNQRTEGWIWKGEWNAVLSNETFVEVRAGGFRTDRAQAANGRSPRFEDVGTLTISGGNRTWEEELRNTQLHASLSSSYELAGSHQLMVGGHAIRRTASEIWTEGYPGGVLHVLREGAPTEVYLFETPSTSKSGLQIYTAFFSDSWRPTHRLTLNVGARFGRYRVFLPEQIHPAGTFNPIERRFPAVSNVADWSSLSPRVGASLDLTGTGRFVVKANYGQYQIPPGLDAGFNANANANPRWTRYTWTDANESGVWEAGEEGALLGQRGGSTVESLDPTLRLPYSREVAGWIEGAVRPDLILRTGIVWRGERLHSARQNINQPFEAFTAPVPLMDPGADGVTGTADDGPIVMAHGLAPEFIGLVPVNVVRNVPNSDTNYTTWEITADTRQSGRWTFGAGFAYTWLDDHASAYAGQPVRANAYPLTPNDLINADTGGRYAFGMWTAKAYSSYGAPWDVVISPLLRHQSGQPYGRTFTANLPGYGNTRILAERIGTRRMDHVTLVDVRIEKRVTLARGPRLGAFVDVFNVFNANPEQALSWSSGSSFLRPLDIVPPRIVRIGARVDW